MWTAGRGSLHSSATQTVIVILISHAVLLNAEAEFVLDSEGPLLPYILLDYLHADPAEYRSITNRELP